MAFKVRQPGLLDGLKVEDKVRFAIEKDGAEFVVTAIEQAAQVTAGASATAVLHAHVQAEVARK
jgi:Copper binding periplasmic protein CusF